MSRVPSPTAGTSVESAAARIDETGLRVMQIELHEIRGARAAARGEGVTQADELQRALTVARDTGAYGHAERLVGAISRSR